MKSTKIVFGCAMRTLVIAALVIYILAPVAWMVNASFQKRAEVLSRPPTWLPSSLYLENYKEILGDPKMLKCFLNSFLVAAFTTLIGLTLGSLAAYAFVRLRMPLKAPFFLGVLLTQMLPATALLIPIYVVIRRLGLLYTYHGLVLAYLPLILPYVIWKLRAYFLSVPTGIEEAAMIDGCSRLGAIFRIFLPLSAPGFFSTAIFAFTAAWNEFLIALIMTSGNTETIPVMIARYAREEMTSYEHMFAASVLGFLPIVLLSGFVQKHIVEGLTEGGVTS